jgi:hypothetical protein
MKGCMYMSVYTQKELIKQLENSIVNKECIQINDIVCEPYLVGTNLTKNTVLLVRVQNDNVWKIIPLNEIYTIKPIEPVLRFEIHPEYNNIKKLFGWVKVKLEVQHN